MTAHPVAAPSASVQANLAGTFTLIQRFTKATAYRPSGPRSAPTPGADHLCAWESAFGARAAISSWSDSYRPCQHVEKYLPRHLAFLLDPHGVQRCVSGGNMPHGSTPMTTSSSSVLCSSARLRIGAVPSTR